jgi:hypothetical protein
MLRTLALFMVSMCVYVNRRRVFLVVTTGGKIL